MVVHIVMFQLKGNAESEEKKASTLKLKAMIEALKETINSITHLEVGINISSSPSAFDLVLYSEFKNEEQLDIYRKHPEHLKVLDYLKEVKEKINVVDYEK